MSPGRCCWSRGSLLLLLGTSLAVLVDIPQDSVNGTLGGSVLLPVSYRFDGAPRFPLSIRWMFCNSSHVLITCTLHNCSWGAGGAPSNCSAHCFPRQTYRSHAQLFPENGSLLLRDLRLSDSGLYSVTFGSSPQTWHVNLNVVEQHSSTQHPNLPGPGELGRLWAIGVCSSVFLLLLFLLFCYLWHRAQQKKRRIIKQQQVSSVEGSHMENTVGRGPATIYARIGDNFSEPQPGVTPEVMYASITSPDPRGQDTGLYHLLV